MDNLEIIENYKLNCKNNNIEYMNGVINVL